MCVNQEDFVTSPISSASDFLLDFLEYIGGQFHPRVSPSNTSPGNQQRHLDVGSDTTIRTLTITPVIKPPV